VQFRRSRQYLRVSLAFERMLCRVPFKACNCIPTGRRQRHRRTYEDHSTDDKKWVYMHERVYRGRLQNLMVTIVYDSWNIERQHPTRVSDVAYVDVEDHAMILTYA